MDLRTKLVFTLVAVSLASMLALGALAYGAAAEPLTRRTLRHLSSLAEAKERELEGVFAGWRDRVSLISSRTQLRRSLRAFGASGAPEDREQIRAILEDARAATETVLALSVYDARGELVAADGVAQPDADGGLSVPGDSVAYLGISAPDAGPAAVELGAPLILDGERIGALRASLATDALLDITGNYTGLGETGEAMIVLRGPDGGARILNPVRHEGGGGMGGTARGNGGARGADEGLDPGALALRGEEGLFTEAVTDYRGEPVWASTRLLPELDWGLVVKFDATEELEPLREFRARLLRVGFSLSAFAILAGILLGLHFSRPIHELVAVAHRVRGGDLGARADDRREDELGVLAGAFNEMGVELERRLSLLQEYQRFFDQSRDLMCIAATDGYFKKVNPAFERSLGWTEAELLNRPFLDFVHPDDVPRTIAETEKLKRGIPTISFENRYRLPDGGYRKLLWTCHPEPGTGRLYASARVAAGAPTDGEDPDGC
ncbi:MAG TPA: HAMP domain-containing protein [Longimicrobiales bacterium]|nr:HAMP domain-containing protein [Longimicrobiales bacterium]